LGGWQRGKWGLNSWHCKFRVVEIFEDRIFFCNEEFETTKGGIMDKEIIIPLAKKLSAGNVNLAVLFGWRAIVDKEKFRSLSNDEIQKAEELMVSGVNQQCETNFKRVDLTACDEYWKGVPEETINRLRVEARKVIKVIQKVESAY
jgi:hypothetical protein